MTTTDPTPASPAPVDDGHVTTTWMETYSGLRFNPLEPTTSSVYPQDIAHALALTCRYGGHVRRFYSVAEHCALLYDYFLSRGERGLALHALLHDAAEAYVGDVVRPVKRELPRFDQIEDLVLATIYAALGLPSPTDAERAAVAHADLRITLNERHALLPMAGAWPHDHLGPLRGVRVYGWSWSLAAGGYMARLNDAMAWYRKQEEED